MRNLKFIFLLTLMNALFCRVVTAESGVNPQLSPGNFSHTAVISVSNPDAATIAVRLPQWSYLATKHQLRDVAVFNGDNVAVAHQLSPISQARPGREFSVSAVPVPLETNVEEALAREADVSVDVKGKIDIHLNQQPNGAKSHQQTKIAQWIVDDPKLVSTVIEQFRFDVAEAKKADFTADVSIETSEDLRHWQTVASHQKIINYGKQRLTQLGIGIQPAKARYWRIISNDDDLSRLTRIYVTESPQMEAVNESTELDCKLNADNNRIICPLQNVQLPVASARFDFGKQRVAINARVSVYAETALPDDSGAAVKPLQSVNAVLTNTQNQAVELNGSLIAALAVSAQNGGKLGLKKAPRLTVQWPAQQLKFLANGIAPFTLAVGAEALDRSAEQAFDDQGTVASGLIMDDPVIKVPQKLTGQHAEKRPWLLWGFIGFAVLSLGWMAVSLLKQK